MQSDAAKASILIVDDIQSNLDILTMGLSAHGYTVQAVNSGKAALEALAGLAPDLLLLDVLMPEMDGYELCRQIKLEPKYQDIPVVFVSALSEIVDKVKGFQVGGVDFVTKPFDFDEVRARVETHLMLARQRHEIGQLLVQREAAQVAEHEEHMLAAALLNTAVALSGTFELDEALTYILKEIKRVIPHDASMVILIQGDDGWVASFESHLPNVSHLAMLEFSLCDVEAVEIVRQTRRSYIVANTSREPLQIDLAGLRSFIAAPVFIDEKLMGLLCLLAQDSGSFAADTAHRLEAFASMVSLAIKNARHYEQAQELAIMQERQRLARELHDSISQTLFAANAIAEVMTRIADAKPEQARKHIPELTQLTREAMAEMRSLLFELRPESLTRTALNLLMKQLCDTFATKTRAAVTLHIPDNLVLPDDEQVVVYRIVQESLNNIAKHAHATEVKLSIQRRPEGIELRLQDNGNGFDEGQVPASFGITHMRDRAASIGAELEIHSQRGQGTEVILRRLGI